MEADPKPAASRRTREETRLLALEAAATLFGQASYEAVSLDDIASASGLRKANLLYHFGSKEQLWRDVVDHVYEAVERIYINPELRGLDTWDNMKLWLRRYFVACRLYPAYVLIPMLEGVTDSWRTDWIADRHLKPHVERWDTYVRTRVAEGVLPPIPPLHLQNILTGGAQHFVAQAALWKRAAGIDTLDEAFMDGYATSILDVLRAAAIASTPPD